MCALNALKCLTDNGGSKQTMAGVIRVFNNAAGLLSVLTRHYFSMYMDREMGSSFAPAEVKYHLCL